MVVEGQPRLSKYAIHRSPAATTWWHKLDHPQVHEFECLRCREPYADSHIKWDHAFLLDRLRIYILSCPESWPRGIESVGGGPDAEVNSTFNASWIRYVLVISPVIQCRAEAPLVHFQCDYSFTQMYLWCCWRRQNKDVRVWMCEVTSFLLGHAWDKTTVSRCTIDHKTIAWLAFSQL